jgi:hypothetical protein
MLVPATLLKEQGRVLSFARGEFHPVLIWVYKFQFVQ